MEMSNLNNEKYDDGSAKYTYYYNGVNSSDHMKQLVAKLEDSYGEFTDIIAKKLASDDKKNIIFFKRYNDFKEFSEKYTEEDYNSAELYEISNDNFYIRVDKIKKSIVVFDYDVEKDHPILSKKI